MQGPRDEYVVCPTMICRHRPSGNTALTCAVMGEAHGIKRSRSGYSYSLTPSEALRTPILGSLRNRYRTVGGIDISRFNHRIQNRQIFSWYWLRLCHATGYCWWQPACNAVGWCRRNCPKPRGVGQQRPWYRPLQAGEFSGARVALGLYHVWLV